jgi:ABC-type phosphate transport system substrate-binding protein
MNRRRLTAVFVAVIIVGVAVLVPALGAAASSNPCTLLKRGEIKRVFAQSTEKPTKGTVGGPVAASCVWKMANTAQKPSGSVSTFVQTVGAKIAFETNRKTLQTSSVRGLGKAFYQATGTSGGVVWVLKGTSLLTVQGVFFSVTEPRVDAAVLKRELVALAKVARKRL